MKHLFYSLVILFVCSFSVSGQQQEPEKLKDFSKITPGLTEHQVREIIGPPARAERFKTVVKGTKDTCTFWVYNTPLYTVVFKNHKVDRVEEDRKTFLSKIQYWAAPDNPDRVQLIYEK